MRKHDYVLTPGRYVGAAALEDDGIPFETKMTEDEPDALRANGGVGEAG